MRGQGFGTAHHRGRSVYVRWNEVAPIANEIGQSLQTGFVHWARYNWRFLQRAGLTKVTPQGLWEPAILRLFVLGGIYADFLHIQYKQGEIDYCDWASLVDWDQRVLEALAISDRVDIEAGERGSDGAVGSLAERYRDEVFRCLYGSYGDTTGLLLSFLVSEKRRIREQSVHQLYGEFVGGFKGSHATLFTWIEGGCCRIPRFYNTVS